MNRFLIAVLVGVLSASCAEAIDDPQPGPDSPVANTPGSSQPFSAQLPDTRIDPTQLGATVATPKEQQTYDNPASHPGFAGEKINFNDRQLDQTTLEHTVENAANADETMADTVTANDLGPDNVQKKHVSN